MVVDGDLVGQAGVIFDKMRLALEPGGLKLRNITRLVAYVTPAALPQFLQGGAEDDRLDVPRELSLPEILDDLERQLILKAYAKAGRVKTETARLLGLKTSALYYKLEKYSIE